MAVLFILGCILSLSTLSEMHPQYHRALQIHPIVESSAAENWAYDDLSQGPFEPPIPPGQYPISFIEMNNQPSISDNGYNEEHRDLETMYPPARNDAIHYEDDLKERRVAHVEPFKRNRTRIHKGNGPQVARMEDGTLKLLYPEKPMRLYQEPRPSYREPLGPLASRAGLDEPMIEREIVFPGPKSGDVFYVPPVGKKGPACAAGTTFCEELGDNINYPANHITKIVAAKSEEYKELFGSDVVNEVNVSQRIDGPEDNPMCQSVEHVVFPKMAQNKEDKWLLVVNTKEYQQGVRVEKCLSEDSACAFADNFPFGYATTCKQKYIFRKLLAVRENVTFSDTFKLPSCCACFVTNNAGTRMGPQSPAKRRR